MYTNKNLFLIDPDIIFLNHGSFGACPRSVIESYQSWQLELEKQPVEFLGRRIADRMAWARASLADFLGVAGDDIVYFPNPTTAMNMVVRNLDLQPGDEILTTDHEYGAMQRTWHFICRQTGAKLVEKSIPLPVSSSQDFIEQFWSSVNPKTRIVFLSHITSPTALIFPVQEICERARQAGIISIIDGAHAPGQIPLNLAEIGADLYTGACHKWLMAPKGSAFLYARREIQQRLMPLIVSWGYESLHPSHSQFIDYHEWQGTRDMAAFLAVPAAIEFQKKHNWDKVRQECQRLAIETRLLVNSLTGYDPICPDPVIAEGASYRWFCQMFAVELPTHLNPELFKLQLYEKYRIEAPVICWNDRRFIRVSIQGYNSRSDVDALIEALKQILPSNR